MAGKYKKEENERKGGGKYLRSHKIEYWMAMQRCKKYNQIAIAAGLKCKK
jgi:hypothetical protein